MRNKLSAVLGIGVAAVFFLTLLGGGHFLFPFGEVAVAEAGPNVTVAPAPVKPKKGKILIAGSGFKPKQELGIRLVMGGVLSDISFMVKPRPVVNKFGAFATTWKLKGREFKRKLLKAGTAYTIYVVDEDGKTLATAPLVIEKAKKKKKKKK
ncbi:MAG: hypothetical protein ACE5JU_14640 [Candidatus Binatia bacterium]